MPTLSARRSLAAPAVAALPLLALCAACSAGGDPPPARPERFVGTIVYEAKARGDKLGVYLFEKAGPRRESVTWGGGGRLRLTTEGGLLEATTVVRLADSAAFILDAAGRTAKPAEIGSLDPADQPDPQARALMSMWLGPAEMKRARGERTVAGRRCRMYRFRRSGMLRRAVKGRACLAEDLRVPTTRLHFTAADGSETMVTFPLQYDIREGLPLLVEVDDDGTVVTYTAVSLTPGEPPDSLFSVPAGYTVQEPEETGG
jgi:hypothetical protein